MGEYFLFANTTKREFIHPDDFGENCKRSGLMMGRSAEALGLLVCRGINFHPLCGSWSGDEVFVTGDEQSSHPATDNPQDTLYSQATREFRNLTYRAIGMLCLLHERFALEFVERAKDDEPLRNCIRQLIYDEGCKPLEVAFKSVFGIGHSDRHRRKKR